MVTVNEYIKSQPSKQQKILETIRELVRTMVPEASEAMGYGVPSFKLNDKPLIYYAGFTSHIGIYPATDELVAQIPALKEYRSSKGTFKFPIDKEIPYDLIKQFVKLRIYSLS